MANYEYKQDVVKPAKNGRFDNVLNKRAKEGWKVESIEKIEENFLITYLRVYDSKIFLTVHDYQIDGRHNPSAQKEIKNLSKTNKMIHFNSSMGQYVCVWEPNPGYTVE